MPVPAFLWKQAGTENWDIGTVPPGGDGTLDFSDVDASGLLGLLEDI